MPIQEQNKWLHKIKVAKVWGIGTHLAPKLQQIGIYNIDDLKNINPSILDLQFSVSLKKNIYELNNIVCFKLEEATTKKKQITCSRSFGLLITSFKSLEQSIALYVSRAAEKLRRQNSYTGSIHIYICTSPFNKKESCYENSVTIPLPEQTDNTLTLIQFSSFGLRKIYRNGYKYQKAGVILSKIVSSKERQSDLFSKKDKQKKSDSLMAALAQITALMGKKVLIIAAEVITQSWKMRQNNMSPRYTTNWNDLIVASQFI
jgi:DNA polymerase V